MWIPNNYLMKMQNNLGLMYTTLSMEMCLLQKCWSICESLKPENVIYIDVGVTEIQKKDKKLHRPAEVLYF